MNVNEHERLSNMTLTCRYKLNQGTSTFIVVLHYTGTVESSVININKSLLQPAVFWYSTFVDKTK